MPLSVELVLFERNQPQQTDNLMEWKDVGLQPHPGALVLCDERSQDDEMRVHATLRGIRTKWMEADSSEM